MTSLDTRAILRTDFASFARKAFRSLHDEKLGDHRYIDFLCVNLQEVAEGKTRRLVINMPPRHLKSFLTSICLPAFVLGLYPQSRIIITAYNDQLAGEMAYKVRHLMQASWYQKIFATRLAQDHARANDFATTQGGGVFSASIDGAITGRGADLLIFDDPLDIANANANNFEQIEKVNANFDTKIMSRLNNPKQARVVVVAHRLNEYDLPGHLAAQGGWKRIVMPMIAPRNQEYDLGYDTWKRKKGDVLRPDAYDAKEIKRLKRQLTPDFETLYQQNPGGGNSLQLKATYFQSFSRAPQNVPVVLSIDAGQRGGPNNSFSVIQAWSPAGKDHCLIDQWAAQCVFEELRAAYWRFVRKYRPAVALIEATAMGPTLILNARRRQLTEVMEVLPDGRSKADRLAQHIGIIKRGHIRLPEDAPWRDDFIAEFVTFPASDFSDQVDACTQYLDFMETSPTLILPPPRPIGAAIGYRGQALTGTFDTMHAPGAAVAFGSRRW